MDALYDEAHKEKAVRERAISAFPPLPSSAKPFSVDPRVAAGANLPVLTHTIRCEPVGEDASSVVSSGTRTTLAVICCYCKIEGHFARRVDGTPCCPVLVRKLERKAMQEAEEQALARKELAFEVHARDLEYEIARKERAYEAELAAEAAAVSSVEAPSSDVATKELSREQKRMAKRKAKSRAKRAAADVAAQ